MRRLAFLLVAVGCAPVHRPQNAAGQQFYQQLCSNQRFAYDVGYNRGVEHQPISTEWVQRCAPDARTRQHQVYLAGYETGVQATSHTLVTLVERAQRY